MATIGEVYGPAMVITDQAQANGYFEWLVVKAMRDGSIDRPLAEALVRTNLGYYSGYFDRETFERVHRLFGAKHPVFGAKYPTPEEAILAPFLWTSEP